MDKGKLLKYGLYAVAGFALYKMLTKPKAVVVPKVVVAKVAPKVVAPQQMAGMGCTGCMGHNPDFVAAEFQDEFDGVY